MQGMGNSLPASVEWLASSMQLAIAFRVPSSMACRVAIIGGGPGGLMTAYQLQQRCRVPFETTIYEARSRLGGKILTD